MPAIDSLKAGRPAESLGQLQELVRKDPSNSEYRIFLFQLLCVLGQWDRAAKQLDVIGEMNAGALAMVAAYRQALAGERARQEVFAGKATPTILGEPEQWMAGLVEALRLTLLGREAEATALRGEALEAAPATAGTLKGPGEEAGLGFQWIADADSRFGPMLEAIVRGRYCWIPFQRLRSVTLEAPEDLRDLVWSPAQLIFGDGGGAVAMIPTRYPGSESAEDGFQMARRTEWREAEGGAYLGLGQRMLATDLGEHPLLDIRHIELASVDSASGADADG